MDEHGATPSTIDPTTAPAPRAATSDRARRFRAVAVLAVLVAAVGFVVVKGLTSALNFYDTVDDALAHRAALGTSDFNLEGTVVAGTIQATATGTAFTVAGDHGSVAVTCTGTPPQLFQAGIPVVVHGHFTSTRSSTFDGDQILVKHSATYIAAHPGRVKAANGTVR